MIVEEDAELRSLMAALQDEQRIRGDCKEKVPMAAHNAYRAKAWECLSLAECTNDPEERADIVRFAWIWMSLAEPIDEARGSYEFPRGR